MNLQRFLDIEDEFGVMLQKTWRPMAAAVHAQVRDLIAADDFHQAYAVAQALNMRPVAEAHRDDIQYLLREAALFGAGLVAKKPVLASGSFESFLGPITDLFVRTVEYNVTAQARDRLLQLIAEAEHPTPEVKKAETQRFVKDFVSFREEGDSMLQLISSLHTSRLSVWGFTGEASVRGITQYQLTAVLDGRTTDYCRMINGKVFLVEDARQTILKVLSAQEPDDVKSLQPWPKQTKAAIASYEQMSAQELTALNLHVPPFHPGCRTICVQISHQDLLPQVDTARAFKPVTQSRAQELAYDHQLTSPLSADAEVNKALITYTTEAYTRINSYLRYTGNDYVWPQNLSLSKEEVLSAITRIGALLDQPTAVLSTDVRLYRGLDVDFLMEQKFGQSWLGKAPEDLVDVVFEDPAFMSFTYDKAVAESFGQAMLVLEARQGERGWQDLTALNPEEKEILRKGGKFRIKSYNKDTNQYLIEALP